MARTKGSLNKTTIQKQKAAVSTALDVDKQGNLTRGGAKIGTLNYVDGLFIARVGSSIFSGWFIEEVFDKVKEAGV